MLVMIPIGFILDIIVWRWRYLAPILLYYELTMLIISSFIPYDLGQYRIFFTFLTVSFTFMLVSCENRMQPILTTLATAVMVFGIQPSIYHIDNTFMDVLQGLIAVISVFSFCIVVTLQITYIVAIRGKMR